ncbi:hypothetical protein D3C72_539800 [compost metagenome]
MNLRDRLLRLKDENRLVVMYFGPQGEGFRARLLRVGQDYVEFEACEPDGTVVGHHIIPTGLLTGVTVSSVERSRETFEVLFGQEAEGGDSPNTPV